MDHSLDNTCTVLHLITLVIAYNEYFHIRYNLFQVFWRQSAHLRLNRLYDSPSQDKIYYFMFPSKYYFTQSLIIFKQKIVMKIHLNLQTIILNSANGKTNNKGWILEK